MLTNTLFETDTLFLHKILISCLFIKKYTHSTHSFYYKIYTKASRASSFSPPSTHKYLSVTDTLLCESKS